MVRRLPSLNALRAFEAAARHQSFTLAAAELNVTHAAISRHIRELELSLGAALFERTGRGVALTEEGARLGQDLSAIFAQLRAATERFGGPRRSSQLVISSEVPFAAVWLVPRLGSFTSAHPGIDLVLDPTNRLVDFSKGEADVGIRYGCGNWAGVEAHELVASVVSPVCSPAFLAAHPLKQPEDLMRVALIRDDPKDNWGGWFAAAGAAAPIAAAGPILKGHLAMAAAETGQGVVLADQIASADALLAGRLVRPFAATSPCQSYYLVRGHGAVVTPAMAAFGAWLEREIARTTAALAAWERGEGQRTEPGAGARKGTLSRGRRPTRESHR